MHMHYDTINTGTCHMEKLYILAVSTKTIEILPEMTSVNLVDQLNRRMMAGNHKSHHSSCDLSFCHLQNRKTLW